MSSTQAAHNKQIMQAVFAELAKGNTEPFRKLYADDVRFKVTGTTRWSKTYEGRKAVREQLFGPLFELLAGEPRYTASRFIAEDDLVVVEFQGHMTTKAGKPYNNTYCQIFRLANDKLVEVTEYCDTALVNDAIG